MWTDGGLDSCDLVDVSIAGAGAYLPAPELAVEGAAWRKVEEHGDARLDRCRVFVPVPGPLQTVHQADFWRTFMALQAFWPGHFGVDNLNVVVRAICC